MLGPSLAMTHSLRFLYVLANSSLICRGLPAMAMDRTIKNMMGALSTVSWQASCSLVMNLPS